MTLEAQASGVIFFEENFFFKNDFVDLEFWEKRYLSENMPWDFHGIPEAATDFLKMVNPNE